MFYSVDEHICVATSDSPEGPFVQDKKEPIWDEKVLIPVCSSMMTVLLISTLYVLQVEM